MSSLRPSQIRAKILREHVALRSQLKRLAAHTMRLEAGQESECARVLELAQSLFRDLQAHIDFEDELLLPVLRDVDAWGPVRAEELARHHSRQRQALLVLAERSSTASPGGLVSTVAEVIAELRADMAHEDRELLTTDLLRDDLVIDAEGG